MAIQQPWGVKAPEAPEGLVFTSEADSPVEAFAWLGDESDLDSRTLRELAGPSKTAPVVEGPFGPVFDALTADQDWHGDEEKQAQGYRKLRTVIEAELSDPAIFRTGKGEVTYFVVGRTAKGNWAGVKADAVQT